MIQETLEERVLQYIPEETFLGNIFLGETIPQNSHQSATQQIPEDPWKLFAESLDKSFFAGKIPIGNFQNPKSYNCLITAVIRRL